MSGDRQAVDPLYLEQMVDVLQDSVGELKERASELSHHLRAVESLGADGIAACGHIATAGQRVRQAVGELDSLKVQVEERISSAYLAEKNFFQSVLRIGQIGLQVVLPLRKLVGIYLKIRNSVEEIQKLLPIHYFYAGTPERLYKRYKKLFDKPYEKRLKVWASYTAQRELKSLSGLPMRVSLWQKVPNRIRVGQILVLAGRSFKTSLLGPFDGNVRSTFNVEQLKVPDPEQRRKNKIKFRRNAMGGGLVLLNVGISGVENWHSYRNESEDLRVEKTVTATTFDVVEGAAWAGAGALVGAGVGSIVPGVGTAIGARVGGVLGSVAHQFVSEMSWYKESRDKVREFVVDKGSRALDQGVDAIKKLFS